MRKSFILLPQTRCLFPKGMRGLKGHFVEMNAAAPGPAGGRWSLGIGSVVGVAGQE